MMHVFLSAHKITKLKMKFTLAIAALAAAVASANPFAPAKSSNTARAAYMSKLIHNARPTSNSQLGRRLEEEEEYEVDISSYSLKFEQCRTLDTNDGVTTAKRFVARKMCTSTSSCSTRRLLLRVAGHAGPSAVGSSR